MTTLEIETIVEQDGEIHLKNLPCRKGDRIQATVVVKEPETQLGREEEAAERRRAAKRRLLELARTWHIKSEGPYASRDELHDRS